MEQSEILLNILLETIEFFKSNPKVGMLGILGETEWPKDKRFYTAWNIGNVLICNDRKVFHRNFRKKQREF